MLSHSQDMEQQQQHLRTFLLTIFTASSLATQAATTIEFIPTNQDPVRFSTSFAEIENPIRRDSPNLRKLGSFAIGIGIEAPTWGVKFRPGLLTNSSPEDAGASIFTPLDTDGDHIDDLYELSHPDLDPLDRSDAYLDPDHNGLTYHQEYRREIANTDRLPQFSPRERTTINYRVPTMPTRSREAITFRAASASLATTWF